MAGAEGVDLRCGNPLFFNRSVSISDSISPSNDIRLHRKGADQVFQGGGLSCSRRPHNIYRKDMPFFQMFFYMLRYMVIPAVDIKQDLLFHHVHRFHPPRIIPHLLYKILSLFPSGSHSRRQNGQVKENRFRSKVSRIFTGQFRLYASIVTCAPSHSSCGKDIKVHLDRFSDKSRIFSDDKVYPSDPAMIFFRRFFRQPDDFQSHRVFMHQISPQAFPEKTFSASAKRKKSVRVYHHPPQERILYSWTNIASDNSPRIYRTARKLPDQ